MMLDWLPSLVRAVGLCLCLCSLSVRAAEAEWRQFELILKRNIFDPSRRPASAPRPPPPPVERVAAPVAAIELRGVFVNGQTALALLSGSISEWQGTVSLEQGAQLGPGKVVAVSTLALLLDVDGTIIEWPVGSRLVERRERWGVERHLDQAMPKTGAPASHSSSRSAAAAGAPAAAAGPTGTDREAILKRLMERRMKETQQ